MKGCFRKNGKNARIRFALFALAVVSTWAVSVTVPTSLAGTSVGMSVYAVIPDAPVFAVTKSSDYVLTASGTAQPLTTVYLTSTGTLAGGSSVTPSTVAVSVAADGTWSYATGTLNAGAYSFSAYVQSTTGTSSTTGPLNGSIVMVDSGNIATAVLGGNQISATGTGFPNGTTEIRIVGQGVDTIVVVPNDASGNFSFTGSELSPGSYALTFANGDAAGWYGSWSVEYAVNIPTAIADGGTTNSSPKSHKTNTIVTTVVSSGSTVETSVPIDDALPPETPSDGSLIPDQTQTPSDTSPWRSPEIGARSFSWRESMTAYILDRKSAVAESLRTLGSSLVALAEHNQTSVLMTSVAAAALPLLTLASSVGSLNALASFGWESLYRALTPFLGIFGSSKRRAWGTVYDGETGSPIVFAKVSLFGANGRFIETKTSDAFGSYYFFVPAGAYTLLVEKQGYQMQVKMPMRGDRKVLYSNEYPANGLAFQKEDIICSDIAMMRTDASLASSKSRLAVMQKLTRHLSSALFWGGFAFNATVAVVKPTWVGAILVSLYALVWFLSRGASKKISFGRIVNDNGASLPFVWINVYDIATHARVARTIADEYGRYFLVLNAGRYVLEASNVNNSAKLVETFRFFSRKALNRKLILH